METDEDSHRAPDRESFHKLVVDSAIQAEFDTGRREETIEEAKRSILIRLLRIVAGFTLIAGGIAALILPGPGWLMIIIGLGMLPFAWAQRTIRLIRSKIPGIPEEGRIPLSTWVILGVTMVTFIVLSMLFADDVTDWVSSLWGDPHSLLS